MYKCSLILFTILLVVACNNKTKDISKVIGTLSNDTVVYQFEPNRKITTFQYLDNDSLNTKIVSEKYLCDSLILKEIYSNNYMSSEYDGTVDAEYIYHYNRGKKLLKQYSYCEFDTSKYQFQYFKENNNCHILRSCEES